MKIKLGLFFVIMAFLSALIMFASPSYPPRAGNGTLVLLLLALSFIMSNVDLISIKNKLLIMSITFVLSVYFSESYSLILKAYKQTSIQAEIRRSSIEGQIKSGESEITIPDFYFTKLMKNTDKFDLYHSDAAYAEYYGVKSIKKMPSTFDYSIINTTSPIRLNNAYSKNGLRLSNIYISDNLFVLESDQSLLLNEDTVENKIFLHVYYKNDGDFVNYDFWPKETIINGKFYYSREITGEHIAKISLGLFKNDNRSISTTVYMK